MDIWERNIIIFMINTLWDGRHWEVDKVLQFSRYGNLVLYGGYFVVQFYFILGLNFISLCFKLITGISRAPLPAASCRALAEPHN